MSLCHPRRISPTMALCHQSQRGISPTMILSP
jgi:hypothetical protein